MGQPLPVVRSVGRVEVFVFNKADAVVLCGRNPGVQLDGAFLSDRVFDGYAGVLASQVSRVMIGKYERGDAVPSIEAAKKIADAFQVSLDYLVGEGQNAAFDKKTVQRLETIEQFPEEEKKIVFALLDAFIRDYKAKQQYAI